MSLDGKIATKNGRANISSPEDLDRMQRLRASVDGIMVGINTLLVDDPSLRLKVPTGREPPARIVVDSSLRTPDDARLFLFPGRIIVGVSQQAGPARVREVSKRAEIVVAGRDRVDLPLFMEKLYDMGLRRILLEGGGTLNWGMLSCGLVDEISLAIAPVIIGGRDAVTLVEGEGVPDMEHAISYDLTGSERVGPDIVLRLRRI